LYPLSPRLTTNKKKPRKSTAAFAADLVSVRPAWTEDSGVSEFTVQEEYSPQPGRSTWE